MPDVTSWIVPGFAAAVVVICLVRRVPVLDVFTEGAKEGLHSCVSLLPVLIGLIMAVTMLQASGALDLVCAALTPVARALGLPAEALPLALMKPVSGSASTALLAQLFETNGPDSFAGRVASVLAGSTETALYCIAVYFGAVKKRERTHALPAALAGHLAACLSAGWAVRFLLGAG